MARILDISPLVSPRIEVWPGDVGFTREVSMDVEQGDPITLSALRTTVHLGAHADAPNHYRAGGAGIGARELSLYYGDCQVMQVALERGERLRPAQLTGPVEAERILFRTGTFPDPEAWNEDFGALSAELIVHLAERGVRLVGIDTPSIDPQDDKALESHQAIADHDMAILEGLVLSEVPDGRYTLIALPLRLEGADASPVRAVLLAD